MIVPAVAATMRHQLLVRESALACGSPRTQATSSTSYCGWGKAAADLVVRNVRACTPGPRMPITSRHTEDLLCAANLRTSNEDEPRISSPLRAARSRTSITISNCLQLGCAPSADPDRVIDSSFHSPLHADRLSRARSDTSSPSTAGPGDINSPVSG